MAAGARSTVRSCWVSLPMTAIACKSPNPNAEPVDVWTTQARCPQAHRFSNSNRAEQNEKCVTHVAGQNCYPCPRLLRGEGDRIDRETKSPHPNLSLWEREPA